MLLSDLKLLQIHKKDNHDQDIVDTCSCVDNDGQDTFFVATSDGMLRVYSATTTTLLYEFDTIHTNIKSVHYISRTKSVITLEQTSDMDLCLCAYHDWRRGQHEAEDTNTERVVRAYTLPLALNEATLAVCSYTGRVVVSSGENANIWQSSDGFFDHIMELHAALQNGPISHVAIHGPYLAIATTTEIRVMHIEVRKNQALVIESAQGSNQRRPSQKLPSLSMECAVQDSAHITTLTNLFPKLQIPQVLPPKRKASSSVSSTGKSLDVDAAGDNLKEDLTDEATNLAGLLKINDLRVNKASGYVVKREGIRILFRRYQPLHKGITKLQFLPESIGISVPGYSTKYSRLLILTKAGAFIHCFSSQNSMIGNTAQAQHVGMYQPVRAGTVLIGESMSSFTSSHRKIRNQPARVSTFYPLPSQVSSIAANSSYLFVALPSRLEIWSIWSPFKEHAMAQAVSNDMMIGSRPPIQFGAQALPPTTSSEYHIIALDSFCVVLPKKHDNLRVSVPEIGLPFEMRPRRSLNDSFVAASRVLYIWQVVPTSAIYPDIREIMLSKQQSGVQIENVFMALYSLFRHRADVGCSSIQHYSRIAHEASSFKEHARLQLEVQIHEAMSKACATDLANYYMTAPNIALEDAARFFAVSDVPAQEVLHRLNSFSGVGCSKADVLSATALYLEATVFPTSSVQGFTSEDTSFTRLVLDHFGLDAPEQIARLVIDSTLRWGIEEIDLCFRRLATTIDQLQDKENINSQVLLKIASLVLLVKAAFLDDERSSLSAETTAKGQTSFNEVCSEDQVSKFVEEICSLNSEALAHLCLTHPELLIRSSDLTLSSVQGRVGLLPSQIKPSILANYLQENSPLFLLNILLQLCNTDREKAIRFDLCNCLQLLGPPGQQVVSLLLNNGEHSNIDQEQRGEDVRLSVFPLRLLFSFLEHKAGQGEKGSSDSVFIQKVGLETMRLLVLLISSATADSEFDKADFLWFTQLLELGQYLPPWAQLFFDRRMSCTEPCIEKSLATLGLYINHVVIPSLQARKIIDLCAAAQVDSMHLSQTQALLVIQLYNIPREAELPNAFSLLLGQTCDSQLVLAYAIEYCKSTETWATFLEIIFQQTMTKSSSNGDSLLAQVAHYLSTKLHFHDLLNIFPAEADLAIFMAAIESNVKSTVIANQLSVTPEVVYSQTHLNERL